MQGRSNISSQFEAGLRHRQFEFPQRYRQFGAELRSSQEVDKPQEEDNSAATEQDKYCSVTPEGATPRVTIC